MIIQTLFSSRIHYRRLTDFRLLSSLSCAKKSVILCKLFEDKINNSLCLRLPNRNVSSLSSVTLPSWFVALSNSAPVAYAQQFVISFHEVTGTPWWLSIILSAVTLRLAITLPLTVYQVGKL